MAARGERACVGHDEIRSMSGRYASYWNAFLFKLNIIVEIVNPSYMNELDKTSISNTFLEHRTLVYLLQNRQEIRHILGEMSMDLPHYHNLEWRFDIQVSLQWTCS